ncbi:hypothetical protein ACU686_20725 [Yinghuangia aomiensis]
MNYVTGVVDVSRAWDVLSTEDTEILYGVYTAGPEGYASAHGVSRTTADRRYRRALGRLTDRMNESHHERTHTHEGPGSRRAMSNATARYITGV